MWTSVPHTPARRTRMRTSSARMVGFWNFHEFHAGTGRSFYQSAHRETCSKSEEKKPRQDDRRGPKGRTARPVAPADGGADGGSDAVAGVIRETPRDAIGVAIRGKSESAAGRRIGASTPHPARDRREHSGACRDPVRCAHPRRDGVHDVARPACVVTTRHAISPMRNAMLASAPRAPSRITHRRRDTRNRAHRRGVKRRRWCRTRSRITHRIRRAEPLIACRFTSINRDSATFTYCNAFWCVLYSRCGHDGPFAHHQSLSEFDISVHGFRIA